MASINPNGASSFRTINTSVYKNAFIDADKNKDNKVTQKELRAYYKFLDGSQSTSATETKKDAVHNMLLLSGIFANPTSTGPIPYFASSFSFDSIDKIAKRDKKAGSISLDDFNLGGASSSMVIVDPDSLTAEQSERSERPSLQPSQAQLNSLERDRNLNLNLHLNEDDPWVIGKALSRLGHNPFSPQ